MLVGPSFHANKNVFSYAARYFADSASPYIIHFELNVMGINQPRFNVMSEHRGLSFVWALPVLGFLS